MPTKKLLGAAAFSAALAAGGVAGALFATPVLSGAQETAEERSGDPTTSSGEAERARPGRHAAKGEHLEAAASVLGMTVEELRTELAGGKSLAAVAAEKGVDKQDVIDALVASATARLDEMKNQLPARMAELVEREGLGRGHGKGGPGPGHGPRLGVINAIDDAATALGISVQELRDALAAGSSIAQVAEAKGKNLADVKAAMVADASARIDAAQAAGRIDADRASELKAGLSAKVDALVEKEGLRMKGRHERGARGPASEATPEVEESSIQNA